MKKTFKKSFTAVFLIVSVALLSLVLHSGLYAFYSDVESCGEAYAFRTGSAQVEITDFCVLYPEKENGVLPLRMGAIASVSFTVWNAGASGLSVSLEVSIAFLDALSESGSLFLFPQSADDESILANAENGIFTGALIGADADDSEDVLTSEGIRSGICEVVDTAVIASVPAGTGVSSREYGFKLFFYPDQGEFTNLLAANAKEAEITFRAACDVAGYDTQWKTSAAETLPFTTYTDLTPPVITEVQGLPTVFFVSQTDDLDLRAYATAFDDFDGDITDRIVISSEPEYDKDSAGVYEITYNVSDRAGNEAVPLTVTITVWDFIKIESGNYHTLALTSHGKVYAWGYNDAGQIGDGTTTFRSVPQPVASLDSIIDIAAGLSSSYALRSDGQLFAWGYNAYGQLGDNTVAAKSVPTQVIQPQGVGFVKISVYNTTAGAIADNGDVYTWGYGEYGAAGTGNWSNNRVPTRIDVSNAAVLSLGYYNGAAVTTDGVLYTWGDNLHGQLGTGIAMGVSTNAPAVVTYFTDNNIAIASVSVGWYHMIALTETGSVYTWGYGAEGRLGNDLLGDFNTPQPIGLTGIKEVYAGYYHTGALSADGEVYFFGQNAYGKHGTGNETNHHTPALVPGITGANSVSLALDSSFILVNGREVYGMGYGGTGVLGNGQSNNYNYPVLWAFTPPPPY